MTSAFVNPSWMPHSVGEAARAGDATADDLVSGRAWSHLLDGLRQRVRNRARRRCPPQRRRHGRRLPAPARAARYRAGQRPAGGVRLGARREAVRASTRSTSGAWTAPTASTRVRACGAARHTASGATAARRADVGLQAMAGMASSANVLLDELDLGPDGEVDLILSTDPHEGNWLPIAENATALVVRHFFYDWDTEVASSLSIERIGDAGERAARTPVDPRAAVARQLIALGDFVVANLDFFLQFSRPETPNTFLPPLDGTAMGAAAENRPVIGSWELAPDEALLVEVAPPQGLYWSYSLGNPWWETIDYGAHQSSLNGHQAAVDDDGILRVVIAHEDPGVANWLDTAGHSAGPIILRCVRTETAPVPATRLVQFSEIGSSLPTGARRVTPGERRATLEARRLAVSKRFCR